ncbi:MAG TPA: lysophospholipid acyltransferase family protein [Allosphingosinicella sp.]
MNAVRSLLFAIIFYTGSLLFVLVCFATMPFGRAPVRAIADAWARFHGHCVRFLLRIRTRIEGQAPAGPALVASKHQSMFETLELITLLDTPAVVMKHELTRIPLWGRLTKRYGIIPIDRAGGARALREMLRQAQAAIGEGRPIVIFPEGTRVPPGERPELQSGFAGLYRALNLPVVPLALDSGRVWPRHGLVKRSGTIILRFGETIPAGLPRKEIEERVHSAINALEDIRHPGEGRDLSEEKVPS